MILQALNHYIQTAQRVEESTLLKHFHLSREGLAPMIAVLLTRGKIQKTIHERGNKLSPEIYYSYSEVAQIPMLSVI